MVESELLGIEKGVATGVEQRIGKFEEAHGGTLFLDEIGDLSLTAQAKILRVLQERVVQHVGGRRTIPVDVRILAATNKDLEVEMKNGNFRQDLFYRLRVAHIQLPALREVPQDIPLLAKSFLTKYCQEMKREPMTLSESALKSLGSYSWPGNARELENEMKRSGGFGSARVSHGRGSNRNHSKRGQRVGWCRNYAGRLVERNCREPGKGPDS